MNTFLLLWNPTISSYTLERLEKDFGFDDGQTDFWDGDGVAPHYFNWDIRDWQRAGVGDRFYMLKIDAGGIIMSGSFTSDPYLARDWRGNGEELHYVNIAFDVVIHPYSPKILASEVLERHLPEINWREGGSGQLLDEKVVAKLDALWQGHVYPYHSLERKALAIALKAHEGQVDKAGEDYIGHPVRVAQNFVGDMKIIALLHDVVEDSDITLDCLEKEGFGDVILKALDALSRREGESYDDFIGRVKDNPIAVSVKLADLEDNMNILRLPELTERDLQRVVKYHKAYRFLQQYSMMQDGSCGMLID